MATDQDDMGGEAVCWLDRLCDSCSAFVEASESGRCWNCGAYPPAPSTEGVAFSSPPKPGAHNNAHVDDAVQPL